MSHTAAGSTTLLTGPHIIHHNGLSLPLYDELTVETPSVAPKLRVLPPQLPQHAAASELPPEIVSRIVEVLSGHEIAIFREDARDYNWKKRHLDLNRKELSRCSLTCRYWAKVLRPKLFHTLHLKSVEDGRLFHTFIQNPASHDLSITHYVYTLSLEYSLSDPPWLHLVFISVLSPGRRTNINLSFRGDLERLADLSNTSSVRLRSIHQSLPRPLPQSVSLQSLWQLEFKNLSFADFNDLASIIHSAPLSSTKFQLHLLLEGIHIKDPEANILMSPLRRAKLDYGCTLQVKGCEKPWLFLRAFLPIRPPVGRPQHSRELPCMQPCAFFAFEQITYAMLQACETCSKEASRTGDNNSDPNQNADTHAFVPRYEIRNPSCHARILLAQNSLHRNTSHILCRDWCPDTALERMTTDFAESGAMVSLAFNVKPGQCDAAEAVPWKKIDEITSTLVPGLQFIDIRLYGVGSISERLVEVIRREMPLSGHAGKLRIR